MARIAGLGTVGFELGGAGSEGGAGRRDGAGGLGDTPVLLTGGIRPRLLKKVCEAVASTAALWGEAGPEMDLRRLQAFVAIAELKNFTKAAELLHRPTALGLEDPQAGRGS